MTRRFDPAEIPPAPDLCFESALWAKDIAIVAGVDEAGRGCWAGPVTAGAVIFPPRFDLLELLPGIRDSKQMPPADREICAQAIQQYAAAWAVGFASNTEIDRVGILPATRLAMARAIAWPIGRRGGSSSTGDPSGSGHDGFRSPGFAGRR